MLDFTGALSKSMQQFECVLRDELSKTLKGELKVVEGITIPEMAKLLDTLAGIDVWYINRLNGMRGIASRIQTGVNYKTFTVRNKRKSGAKTEYEKRKIAIEKGYLYPNAHITSDIAQYALSKAFESQVSLDEKQKTVFADGLSREEAIYLILSYMEAIGR